MFKMADKVHFLVKRFNWGTLVAFSLIFKFLLVRTYRSTDFEVHRNWLAITHSLPISKWYLEDTSEWTLDYPPLFAWFEFVLSQFAVFVDPEMVKVSNLNYASEATVIFQRVTVMISDLMLIYAVKQYYDYRTKTKMADAAERALTVAVLVVFNVGLLLVDHIHFQYNGFLFGMLLLSITRMMEGFYLESAFWFAVLLNFKHIFLYMAPAYFIFLLRDYCFQRSDKGPHKFLGVNLSDFSPWRLIRLGFLVISVFLLAIGPFLIMGQLPQLLSRLFPFKRGLCHAYWAPNVWALYNIADKMLLYIGVQSGFVQRELMNKSASMTGGLVGQSQHVILPSVRPLATMILTLLSIMPSLWTMWYHSTGSKGFLRSVVLCAFGSFLFGWHVHEKAIIMVIIPLSLLAVEHKEDARIFLILACAGHFSLFPLIFTPQEYPIKLGLMAMFTLFALCTLDKQLSTPSDPKFTMWRLPIVHWYESLYIIGMDFLEIYCELIHWWMGFHRQFPFIPLLLRSVYCAVGVVWAWLLFYHRTLPRKAPTPQGTPMTMKLVSKKKKKK